MQFINPTYNGILSVDTTTDTQFVLNLHANATGNSCTLQFQGGASPALLDLFVMQIEGSTTLTLPSIGGLQWLGGSAPTFSTTAGLTDWIRLMWNFGPFAPLGQIMAIGLVG